MESIRLKINGVEIEARPGQTILEVVREQEIDTIPTLCHSDELAPYGSCFVCVVEVKGRANLVPACATRIMPDMEVETRNDRVRASRKTALELLLSNHYADCVSPCLQGCPAGVDAQGYLALAGMGLKQEAVDLIREANPLPAICGRVCVRKCEVVCRRTEVDQPVGINAVKRYVTDARGVYDENPTREPDNGKSVGIVGAGPASLTAAFFLGRKGYRPVLYEAMPKGGGMLRYGIPTYRLPDEVIDREINYIERAGAEIQYGVKVGEDVSLDDLRAKHDALFLGAGAWAGKPMRVEGEFETEGVEPGAEYLCEKAQNPEPVTGTVVVVGGGNTAMDVARTSWRLGADKVIILYRRTKAEMPADEMEIEDCIDEGIELMELAAPVGIVAEKGKLKALRCIRMVLGEPDASGRRRPVPLEGSEFELPCHLAVSAIGQEPVLGGLKNVGGKDLSVSRWETIDIDTKTMATNIPGVFAGGDAADDGPTVVIDAIRDGQWAAKAIHAFISGEAVPAEPFVVTKAFWSKPGKAELGEVPESPRHEVHTIEVDERKGSFTEVATGFEPEDAAHEVDRCLSCGCVRFADCDLRLYAEEYGVDMNRFSGYVRKHKIDDRHPYIDYDPNKCILCARCIRTCANVLTIPALGLVGRGFRTEMRPAMNDPLVETNCNSCGNCVDSCPTGALSVKLPFPGRACLYTDDVSSSCAFCSLGCEIRIRRYGDNRYYITSSGEPGQYLCRYGRFGYERFIKQRRLIHPTVRDGMDLQEVDFDEAYEKVINGLRKVVEEHGPESVAVFASPELTNEELYLAGRIAREGLRTNNVASLTLLLNGNESGVLDSALGCTASTTDRQGLQEADLIVCNNTSMENDHLILSVEVVKALRGGAKLMIANSTLDTVDHHFASVAMDPMRGWASVLWSGVIKVLLEDSGLDEAAIRELPGGEEFLGSLDYDLETVVDLTGVDEDRIRAAADHLRQAKRIVFIHSPDRPMDQSPADLETLGNLLVLLRKRGTQADLLLPPMTANGAGVEICGADPGFAAGRRPVPDLPGAKSHAELRELLKQGAIRGALIIGEDPMRHNRTGTYFQNAEFIAAVDWAVTETTQWASVTLPGSTYLESAGTRCNFEGRRIDFAAAIPPPSGRAGWQVLQGLGSALGVGDLPVDIGPLTQLLEKQLHRSLNGKLPLYWNTGEPRTWEPQGLVAAQVKARPVSIAPPLTHSERYKKEVREVGTARYRVH